MWFLKRSPKKPLRRLAKNAAAFYHLYGNIMNNRILRVAEIAVLAAVSAAQADVLSLTRGDLVSGSLLEISGGIVVFDTGLAGQIVVPVSQVRCLSTDDRFVITLAGGKQLQGRFAGNGNATRIVSESGEEVQAQIKLAEIEAIAPAAKPPSRHTRDSSDARAPIAFSWESGYLYRWGNENYDSPFTRLLLRNQADAFDFYSENLLELSDEQDFPRLFRSSAEWRLPSARLFHPELGIDFERDLDEALEFRGGLNAGFTRAFLDEPDRLFEVTGGLNVAFEYYDAARLWRDSGSLRHRIQDLYYADEQRREEHQDINLRLRLRFRQSIGLGSLAHSVSLYPGLTDFGELRARSESSFRLPLTSQLNFRLHLLLDFEDQPEFEGLDKWRTSIGAGIEWDF